MAPLPDFDELKEMAERDPEEFENYRMSMCEAFIDSIPVPHRQRLRAVQFRVNTVIHRAKTPMAGLLKVSGMMHDSLYSLSEHLIELNELPLGAPLVPTRHELDNVVEIGSWVAKRKAPYRQH